MEEEIRANQKISWSLLVIEEADINRKTISNLTYQGLVKPRLHLNLVKDRKGNNDAHQNAYLFQRSHQLV
jgi:hypothetical protein